MASYATNNYILINNNKTLKDKIKKLQKTLSNFSLLATFIKLRYIRSIIKLKNLNDKKIKEVCLMRFGKKIAFCQSKGIKKKLFY